MTSEHPQPRAGRKPRVAVVGPGYPYRGGISHHTTLLCRHLAKSAKVSLVNYAVLYPSPFGLLFPGKTQYDRASALRFPNARILSTQNPLSWARTARRILGQKPDRVLLIWHHPVTAPAFGYLVRKLSPHTRVVVLCHNVLPHEMPVLGKAALRFALKGARAFLVQSERERERLLAILSSRVPPPVRVVRHPIYDFFAKAPSAPLSAAALRKRLRLDGKKVILFFGYVRPYKGLKYLVSAMPAVAQRHDAALVVAGEFYEPFEPYNRLVRELGVAGRVRLVDRYIPNGEVRAYFALADVLVCPYTEATQSGIIQAALGFAIPVVATRVGGLPDSVSDPQTGRLVDPRDSAQLAVAISAVLERPKAEYAAGIKDFKKRFSWDALVQEVLAA